MATPSLSSLKTWMGTSSSAEDAVLTMCLNSAIATMESICGQPMWFDAAKTQNWRVFPLEYPYFRPDKPRLLMFNGYRDHVDYNVKIEGVTYSAAVWRNITANVQPVAAPYWPVIGLELLPTGSLIWSQNTQFVQVYGSWAMFYNCPSDVEVAVLRLAQWVYNSRRDGGAGVMAFAQKGGPVLVERTADIPEDIRAVFLRYRAWVSP